MSTMNSATTRQWTRQSAVLTTRHTTTTILHNEPTMKTAFCDRVTMVDNAWTFVQKTIEASTSS